MAINGFGRIGRALTRIGVCSPDISIVAVNDLVNIKNLAYMLKYDSVHGKYAHDIHCCGNQIIVKNKSIKVFQRRNPLLLPWRKLGIDVVVEATGRFRNVNSAFLHRLAGAKKVVITANPQNADHKKIPVIIFGVNEKSYKSEPFISAGSCSANCAGPLIKILHEKLVIKKGFMTAIHAYTKDQRILDSSHSKDWRRGRAGPCNIVPAQSDAALILSRIISGLENKINGMTIRVPVPDGSLINFVCEVENSIDRKTLNSMIKHKANTELSEILHYCDKNLVSKDIVNNKHSSILDSLLTDVSSESMLRIVCWFDHEYGYAARVLDLVKMIGKR